jgi:hypothetical protein
MKLSKEEIKFIGTYLLNNNVVYIDIRQEMMDHISSAVENKMEHEKLDFYDAFKKYMIENKSDLMKINKTSMSFSWNEIYKFLKYLISPKMILISVLMILSYFYLDINSYFSKQLTFSNLVFILFISVVLFQLSYYYLYLKKKYYCIEKTGQMLLVVYFLLPLLNDKSVLISLIFLFILIGYVFYFFKQTSTFNKYKFELN